MKILFILSISSFLLIGYGCQKKVISKQNQEKQAVRKAVKFAYGLEQQLWNHKSLYKTRKQVYEHYRQGFSDELAESLTSYSWSDGELRATEKTMEPPDTVHIISITNNQATVYYRIPDDLRNIWQLKKYSIDLLRKDGDRWIIYQSNETDTIPTSEP